VHSKSLLETLVGLWKPNSGSEDSDLKIHFTEVCCKASTCFTGIIETPLLSDAMKWTPMISGVNDLHYL
jgi:hypothetical protein